MLKKCQLLQHHILWFKWFGFFSETKAKPQHGFPCRIVWLMCSLWNKTALVYRINKKWSHHRVPLFLQCCNHSLFWEKPFLWPLLALGQPLTKLRQWEDYWISEKYKGGWIQGFKMSLIDTSASSKLPCGQVITFSSQRCAECFGFLKAADFNKINPWLLDRNHQNQYYAGT